MSELVMGLDGGGSKTLLALADREGNVTVFDAAVGINAMDNPKWKDNFQTIFSGVTQYQSDIVSAVLGIPAFGETKQFDADYHAFATAIMPYKHMLINDVFLAHEAAFAGGEGVTIVAGTGAMLVGGKQGQNRKRVGGWGEGFGDEGGAYWIGIEALRTTSHALDMIIDAPEFLSLMMQLLRKDDQSDMEALLNWYFAQDHQRSAVAGLARHVDHWADDGNEIAQNIMRRAAGHLHQQYVAMWKKLGGDRAPDWSFAGSVLNSGILKNRVTNLIGKPSVAPILPPVGGGLWLAAKSANWDADKPWIDKISKALESNKIQPTIA